MSAETFPTIADAADAWLAIGGRIYLLPSGLCEETISAQVFTCGDAPCETARRYHATLATAPARAAMASHVHMHGRAFGSAVVLEARG